MDSGKREYQKLKEKKKETERDLQQIRIELRETQTQLTELQHEIATRNCSKRKRAQY